MNEQTATDQNLEVIEVTDEQTVTTDQQNVTEENVTEAAGIDPRAVLAALASGLEEAAASSAPQGSATPANLCITVQCQPCGGDGVVERDHHADVPRYRVLRRRAQQLGEKDLYSVINAPHATLKDVCLHCVGRGWLLTKFGSTLLLGLSQVLRGETTSHSMDIERHNASARAHLDDRVREHEEARARNEQADRLERAASERLAELRKR